MAYSMKENGLEQYYGKDGDHDWANVVKSSALFWTDSPLQQELVHLLSGRKDLAIVINDRIGEKYAASWLKKKIPALDNLRPLDCLGSDQLLRRLKEALMRM